MQWTYNRIKLFRITEQISWLIYKNDMILLIELNYIEEEAHDQIFGGLVFIIYFVQN